MCLSEDIVCGFVQHSGFLHVALGCWVLLTFGPQVCRGYGPFTFFLIYILGGIAGNLSSFLHTPEATVGGTVSREGTIFVSYAIMLLYVMSHVVVIYDRISIHDLLLKYFMSFEDGHL